MKKNFFLDFDGVVTDSKGAFCEVYNELFCNKEGFKPAYGQFVNKWDFTDQCTLIDKKVDISRIFADKRLFEKLQFMPNAREIIQELNEVYNIMICSMGTLGNITYKSEWIQNNLPFIENSIFLNIGNSEFGKSVVNMNGGIIMDDNSSNLFSSDAKTKVCFGEIYSWNSDWTGQRATNWEEVRRLFMRDGVSEGLLAFR